MTPKKVPRYRAIANDLTHAIVSHKYAIGSALPPESDLCAQLQASRHTVREALRILEESGLIARRQGSGSEVIANTPPVRYRQTVDTIEDLLQYGNASRLQLLSAAEVPATEALATQLGCTAGTPVIELRALRCERRKTEADSGQPFALSHIHFPPQPPRRREKLLDAATALPTMLGLLDARTLGRIEQVFEAVALDAEAAALLCTRKGAPSLRVHRAYYDRKGGLILVAVSWHRADLFRYATVLRHESA
jgi:DNA-binding GntR family transcriptional regulator